MSESIIIDIEPFPNPENDIETEANRIALAWYADKTAREEQQGQTMHAIHPEKPDHAYMVSFGWTRDGWRVFAVLMDERTFGAWSENTREFVVLFASGAMERRAQKLGIGMDTMNDMAESVASGVMPEDAVLQAVAERLAASPDCGDPACSVHGGTLPYTVQRLKASLEDRFGLPGSN
jgi:hypothetical protein